MTKSHLRLNPLAQLQTTEDVADRLAAAIADPRNIFDSYQLLEESVRNGQPIYLTGELSDTTSKLHVATVNKLLQTTGMPVTVIHSPK